MYFNSKDNLVISAIDIGSNSIHGIIAYIDDNGVLTEVFRDKASVRLGTGMKNGIIREEELIPALEALERFKYESQKHNAIISAVATSAVREAKNKNDFLKRVKNHTEIEVNVLTGKQEGEIIYKGLKSQIPSNINKRLIIDIGGGSTEFILAIGNDIILAESLKLGAIRTSEEYFDNYNTSSDSLHKCMEHINKTMSVVVNKISSIGFDIVFGTSGTSQALGRMVLGNKNEPTPNFLNNIKFYSSDISKIIDKILALSKPEERMTIAGLEQSRAELISAGGLIMKNFLNQLKINEIMVSSFGLREGVVYDTFEKLNIKK
jgi:exopolyphosphatase / guanosine-5'-triphosphate,3'-diphosphate pyrophosphatase